MATSGSTTFSLTSDQLVNAALRKISVLGDGQTPTSTQLSNSTQALNTMLCTFTAKGMPLWVVTEYAVTPTSSSTYTMGIGQTINIPAPLKVSQSILKDTTTGAIIPMTVKTHYDFNLLPTSSAPGAPISYWYEPLNQTGVLHIWPSPDSYTISNRVINIVYQRPFQNMVSGTDTLDFPQWWHEAIIFGLAWRMCGDFGIPLNDRANLAKEAEYFLEEALSFGTEEGSLYFMPDWTARGKS